MSIDDHGPHRDSGGNDMLARRLRDLTGAVERSVPLRHPPHLHGRRPRPRRPALPAGLIAVVAAVAVVLLGVVAVDALPRRGTTTGIELGEQPTTPSSPGGGELPPPIPVPATGDSGSRQLLAANVYFARGLRDDGCVRLQPVRRLVNPDRRAHDAILALLNGPTPQERQEGFTSVYNDVAGDLGYYGYHEGVATVSFTTLHGLTRAPGVDSRACRFHAVRNPLEATLRQFEHITQTRYLIAGDESAFSRYLDQPSCTDAGDYRTQEGEECD